MEEEDGYTGEQPVPQMETEQIKSRICLVKDVLDDQEIVTLANQFNVPVVSSETGADFILDQEWTTYFVMKEFDGPIFDAISKSRHRILGPPALRYFANTGTLPSPSEITRPKYNFSMKGVITCFTGIRKREELTRLVFHIHAMGGSIRKDMNSKVTHLICPSTGGDKYRYAKTFRLGIVRPKWVEDAWQSRDAADFSAIEDTFTVAYRLKPFEGQRICFSGFTEDEHKHMIDVLRDNGGVLTTTEDPDCSHVIVDEQSIHVKPELSNSKTFVVKADWFWYTIQNGYADESEYLLGDHLNALARAPKDDISIQMSMNNKRKRKRLSHKTIKEELLGTPKSTGKRRSSVSDAGLLSMSGSFLDCTLSPDKHLAYDKTGKSILDDQSPSIINITPKVKSMRFNHFMDFYQTESNYVGILDIIDQMFKQPLEKMAESEVASEALLNKSEIKAIFSNFPPIHEVHKNMLNCLKAIAHNWTDDCLIGSILLNHRNELLKAYPPYINFFEQMKESLIQCDNQNSRFHAFLKINQAKPECGRQSLQDLMIRPVQRLPSISLLLNDILKHTPEKNPDSKYLKEALITIKGIMKSINEGKRKTEGQLAIFEIFKEIENCPPHLVSSHRTLISKCDVFELSDLLSGRGHALVFLLFNDTLEVCKKRSRGFNSAKSPNAAFNNTLNQRALTSHAMTGGAANAGGSGKHSMPYKHVDLVPLNQIRRVVDIRDSPQAFAIGCRLSKENKDKYYYFSLSDEMEFDKLTYLKILCKQMAENACRADADIFLASVDSSELDFDLADLNLGTLSRAFKLATKTRLKVGRVFSFNKTPSKLKRAVSTMMTSPFGSTTSLTPAATQLAQMRLASCNNLNKVGDTEEPTNITHAAMETLQMQAGNRKTRI